MPVVKGGVWTNIEDEVLKAAISKYGLNQWARVSSLLARKTPKQCKARWSEWLDPGIRKVEWSREEDERLLHLAKIMPTQWRTIAPIVGRTATQCLERYQKLLDEAEARENDELALGGPAGGEAAAPSADDVRRLRPGELDPDPESKPARPDTIDMDEDEKEMLSEARARLANTQGKKAKRKARERQLEESRRLALLQKRRELKNAGINTKITYRKKGQMDYNADIPFERTPAAGFYDTTEEIDRNEKQRLAFDPKRQQLANKRKPAEEDDQDRKRKKTENSQDGPSAAAVRAAQLQKLRDAERSSNRRSLNLPAPQVSESELEDIVKMGMAGEKATRLAGEGDNDATRGIVGNYSNVQQTPIRTPMAPPATDRIANTVKDIRALTETKSSLLGGENADLSEEAASTGFDGITPRASTLATPNPIATPMRQGVGPGSTPRQPGATPMRTPRDTYSLNQNRNLQLASATPRDIRLQEKSAKDSIKTRLAALPKPKETDWELELPEEQKESPKVDVSAEDSADRDRRLAAIEAARKEAEFKRQTQVIQKKLPRPMIADVSALHSSASNTTDLILREINQEAANLIENDMRKFPIGVTPLSGRGRPLQNFSDASLNSARQLLAQETSSAQLELNIGAEQRAWTTRDEQSGPGLFTSTSLGEDRPGIRFLENAFSSLQARIMEQAEQSNAIEKKLGVHLGGYKKRSDVLRNKTGEAFQAYAKSQRESNTKLVATTVENAGLASRLERLREEVTSLARIEREAQEAYRIARDELSALRDGAAATTTTANGDFVH